MKTSLVSWLFGCAIGLSSTGLVLAFGHGGGGHFQGGHVQNEHAAFAQHPNHNFTVVHPINQYHPMTQKMIRYTPAEITKTAIMHPISKPAVLHSVAYHPNVVVHPNTVVNYHPNVAVHPNVIVNYHPVVTPYHYWNHGYYPVYNNYWYHGHYPVNYPYYPNYWYYHNVNNYNNGVNDFLAAALVISVTANVLQAESSQSQTTVYYPAPVYYYPYPGYYAPVPYMQPVVAP